MRIQGRTLFTTLLVVIATIQALLLYSVNLDAQEHLKQRLEGMATHAGIAEVALRAVERNPDNVGEWVRATVHLQSFNTDTRSLGDWVGMAVAPGRPGLYPTSVSVPDLSGLGATRASLAASEQLLRQLANKPFVRTADVKQLLTKLEVLSSQADK